MIVRPHYLNELKKYRDVPLVKILAGIRLLKYLCNILQNNAGTLLAEARLLILIAHYVPSVF